MNPWTFSPDTTRPLTRPMPAETTRASATPGRTFPGWFAMRPAESRLARLMTYGTDRSRLPTRITSVWPIAMKPRTLVPVRIAEMLPALTKLRPVAPTSTVPTTTVSSTTR